MKRLLLSIITIALYVGSNAQQQTVQQEKDNLLYADKTNPYAKLEQSLNGIGNASYVRDFTTFRGLDFNFSQARFSAYLQDQFNLTYIKSVDSKNAISIQFKPKVTTSNEYMNVKYVFENRKDLLGYYKTEDNTYKILTSVEITGTKKMIIDLFLSYWKPLQTTLGIYKIGEVANKEFWNDKIVLYGLSATLAKIAIQKGNTTMDYYKTFGVNAPKK